MSSKLVVFLHHGLGDVIMALPALWCADGATDINLDLTVVVKSPLEASIISSVPWRGTVRTHCLPGVGKLRRVVQLIALSQKLRRMRPNALLTPHISSPRLALGLSMLVAADRSILPAKRLESATNCRLSPIANEHKSSFYARYFEAAGIPMNRKKLNYPPLTSLNGSRPSGKWIALAPAVGAKREQHKAWPAGRFSELAIAAMKWDPKLQIVLTGAPSERKLLESVAQKVLHTTGVSISILTKRRVVDAAAALVGASAIVTSCSGASHLAAWAGIPIVGLYGPTNPNYTGPFSNQLYAVRKGYGCSPCYRSDFMEGCGNPICVTDISVEDAFVALRSAILGDLPQPITTISTTLATAPNMKNRTS